MLGGLLSKSVFLTLVCQKHRQGRDVDARWVSQLCGVTKKTALLHLQQMVADGDLVRKEVPWRDNAKKFYWTPTARVEFNYDSRVYLIDYRVYLHAMMKA